ncbi:MAG TPA: HD domain-containing phosphohydrolase [Candidatus Desulfaltia sp.]|nr:HD domain-containing phosphohydrolase [Candidatus Desulfaltia sp.]
MTPPHEERTHPDKTKALHQLAVEMITRLNVILKGARIYEPNNLLFQRQVTRFLTLLREALRDSGEASFAARGNTLFFNNIRLKYGFANYHFFRFVLEEFRRKQLGAIKFEPEVSEGDLGTMMIIWAKGDSQSAHPYDALVAEARKRGVRHIAVDKMLPSDLTRSKEESAAKVFFLGMTHLEEAFEGGVRQERIHLGTTRRLMQSIFNHISDHESFVQGLTNIKNFHEYTLNHSMNVCILSVALGKRLGLDRNELVDLGISAFFHDFGKLDTPKEILDKPGKLDDQEREIIEKHPYQGAGKLVQFKGFKNLPLQAIQVALEHHIKEDMTGYPRYFKTQSTNLFSKIVKIADFFDAVTTPRVYRTKHFTRDEALTMMLAQSGKEFHPLLLREFIKMMGVYPIGSLVGLNSLELAVVVENNPDTALLLRPRVKLITDASGNKRDGEIVDLSEVDPVTGKFVRTIVKVLDPDKYGIRVADYFLARAM